MEKSGGENKVASVPESKDADDTHDVGDTPYKNARRNPLETKNSKQTFWYPSYDAFWAGSSIRDGTASMK
jgi:hypothetical protein